MEKIESVADLVRHVSEAAWSHRWYRGHSELDWKLQPTLLREYPEVEISRSEKRFLRKFQQQSVPFIPAVQREEWEWMFLMQHFGVPTRFLDWSESPLVALYFAVYDRNGKIKQSDGAFWCLDPDKMNAKFKTEAVLSFGVDTQLESYLSTKIDIPPTYPPLAILAQRQFARLQAQQGVFVIFHKETEPLEERLRETDFLVKYSVPKDAKENISKELNALGITRLSLFPELEQVGKLVREVSHGGV